MRNKFLFVSLFLVLTVLLSACGATPGASSNQRVLSVSGTGQVFLQPDMAYIFIGVTTESESATDAVARNNADTQRLLDTLKAAGVAEADLRTSNFSIWQNTPYGPDGLPGKPVYRVDNTVYVTVRDLSKLGNLLDAAVRAGANSINSIQFDVADKTQALSQARKAAVEAARKQAEELAQATGVQLGNIQNIQYYDSTPVLYTEKGMGGGGDAAAIAVPINPGQLQITATVTISYEIK
ncbi:MAG: SIMPL domain-containing protein [Anaerolineales bacterium]|nr:SIMPL domain-containing protein [Anaerolineales bacterium]MDW8278551.1 SIMPL domain-containing protein [Anaerolineales bacterium]